MVELVPPFIWLEVLWVCMGVIPFPSTPLQPVVLPFLQESWPWGHEGGKASSVPSVAVALRRVDAVPCLGNTVEMVLMAKVLVCQP